jgi:hypothetical protein
LPHAILAAGSSSRTPGLTPRRRLAVRVAATLAAALLTIVVATRPAGAQQRDTTRRDSTARDTVVRDTTRAAPRPLATDSAARDTTAARRRGRVTAGPRRSPVVSALPDSLARPPISARRAFLYSLLVPGQGQTSLHRPKAAALFATVEIGTIAMIAKSKNDLRIARARVRDSVVTGFTVGTDGDTTFTKVPDRLVARIRARRLHVEDWMATLLFNHLFSGADAFVAAQLWDLPGQVSFRPMPRGAAVTISVPW